MRWAVLLVPFFFMGCFDSPSATNQSAKGVKTGIAAISRFFTFGHSIPDNPSDASVAAEATMPMPGGISSPAYPVEDISEISIAAPVSLSSTRGTIGSTSEAAKLYFPTPRMSGRREWSSDLGTEAKLVFNTPFGRLISTVFKPTRRDDGTIEVKDELLNPFIEARLRQESASPDTSTTAATRPDHTGNTPEAENAQTSAEPSNREAPESAVASASGSGVPIGDNFLVIGDFDGSGTLRSMMARRSSDTSFVSQDGKLDFNLFINPAAAEQQRAFYIDDINGDEIPDLLVTNRISLFGGVLLGDGAGGYSLVHKFVTGYEPTIPSAGPFRDGTREILTVNVRSGVLTTFRAADHYRQYQTQQLALIPDYLLHLVAPGTSTEFLMVAQMGGAEQILRWRDNFSLEPTVDTLPADPVVLSSQFGSNAVQVYQVGSYASVMLTSQGRSFNVANLHVSPRIFLIIGDLQQRGSTDVAVANLILFTPKSSR